MHQGSNNFFTYVLLIDYAKSTNLSASENRILHEKSYQKYLI